MSWEQDRQELTAKLERIVAGTEKILSLQGNNIITDEKERILREQHDAAVNLLPKLQHGEFEIAVVGLEKAGKSTFCNALLGLVAVPSMQTRCTYTSTCICAGSPNRAEVVFLTRDEFTREFQDKLEAIGVKDARLYSPGTLKEREFEELYAQCGGARLKIGDGIRKDILEILKNWGSLERHLGQDPLYFTESHLHTDDFRQFIANPAHAIAVRQVTIYSTHLSEMKAYTGGQSCTQNIIMYDVPGFNSPVERHKQQTLERMKSADVIIAVANGEQPSLTGEALGVFQSSDLDGTLLSEKLFVFVNRIDYSNNIDHSRSDTLEQWIHAEHILDNKTGPDRVVLGSASARLGEEPMFSQLDEDEKKTAKTARDKLRAENIPDGIDTMWDKLTLYYQQERFQVLRKRVEQIPSRLEELFRNIDSRMPSAYDGQEQLNAIVLALYSTVCTKLVDGLRKLKDNMNAEISNTLPLQNNLHQYIQENITVEQYGATDEMIREHHLKVVGVNSGVEQPGKVDGSVREEQFSRIYSNFVDGVFQNVRSQHERSREGIFEVFRMSLGHSVSSARKAELTDAFAELCGLNEGMNHGYYESLVERFARDLFEILIKFSRSDRIGEFRKGRDNYLSLSVYYNRLVLGDDRYIQITPEDSVMWRLLLTPEIMKVPDAQAVLTKIQDLTGCAVEELQCFLPQVDTLISASGSGVMTEVDRLFANFDRSGREPERWNRIKRILEKATENVSAVPALTDILENGTYFSAVPRSYDEVRAGFNQDVEVLRDVLLHAFIPAVDMDKAFRARETKLIEDVIALVETSSHFQQFIARYYAVIVSDEVDEIRRKSEQSRIDAAVMNQIQDILSGIRRVK